jgi:hypothetical protein
VAETELGRRGVAPLEMIYAVKKLRVLPESACDCAKPADVLRRAPACVVSPAVAVGDERGARY